MQRIQSKVHEVDGSPIYFSGCCTRLAKNKCSYFKLFCIKRKTNKQTNQNNLKKHNKEKKNGHDIKERATSKMLTWWGCSSFLLTKWHSHCANSSQTCGRHMWQPGLTLPSRVGNTELDQLKAQDRAKTQAEKLKQLVKLKQVSTKQKTGIMIFLVLL